MVTERTRLSAALAQAARRLAAAGVPSPRHDAEALAAHLLGIDRRDLVRCQDIETAAFEALVAQRADRRPLQHLTGLAHFRRVSLAVGPGVFIPRPETEVMVGQAVQRLAAVGGGARAVDLCTGSGAIALCLATEVSGAEVHAVEIDPGAHAWAKRNLDGSGVRLHLADAGNALGELAGQVDVVVCNPPYIPLSAWESVAPEARDHDPPPSLWGGSDGLEVARAVERSAARLLRRGGWIAMEHADVQGAAMMAVFAATGAWSRIRDNEDLTGRDRFVTAVRV